MWKAKTNKGRVVYNRKPHAFSCSDLKRVARGSDCESLVVDAVDWEAFVKKIEELISTDSEVTVRFGGGTFGGAGATRAFGGEIPIDLSVEENNGIIVVIRAEV